MTPQEFMNIREANNLTKSAFAAALNITPMLVGRYEKGSCEIPEAIASLVMEKFAKKSDKDENIVEKAVKEEAKKAAKKVTRKVAGKVAKDAVKVAAGAVAVNVAKGLVDSAVEAEKDKVKVAAEENAAELVKNVRSGMGISQKAFAGLLGVSGSAVSLYEKGKSAPGEAILDKIRELQSSSQADPSEQTGSELAEEKEPEPVVEMVSEEEPIMNEPVAEEPSTEGAVFGGEGMIWIILIIVVVAGGAAGLGVYFRKRRKS